MRKIDLTDFRPATSETARQINRRIALNFIRLYQPMSRADLARRSGLQRSTISSIIDQLIDEGWVTEGAIGRSPRGRRPRNLHLNVERAGILGVELRPEVTTVGLAGIDARFMSQVQFPTAATPERFVADLAVATCELRRAHPRVLCEGMGVSLPGRVDKDGNLVFAPNLGWEPVAITRMIEKAVGLPVNVENAANACALAELWFGRHPEQVQNILAVTVSEGVGVGLLLNGQLVHGAHSMAGEFGHVSLADDGPPCRCGRRGCWERYASNSAALQYYASIGGASPSPRFEDLPRLADRGDVRAAETLERMARYLGVGLSNLAVGLDPHVIAVVGEVTTAWSRVGPIVEEILRARALAPPLTRLVPTDSSAQPRLRGAVTLVVQQHFGAPAVA
jgi:predicted NBD/HSP70 family sugar kinase